LRWRGTRYFQLSWSRLDSISQGLCCCSWDLHITGGLLLVGRLGWTSYRTHQIHILRRRFRIRCTIVQYQMLALHRLLVIFVSPESGLAKMGHGVGVSRVACGTRPITRPRHVSRASACTTHTYADPECHSHVPLPVLPSHNSIYIFI
jgi:hypothetical protein